MINSLVKFTEQFSMEIKVTIAFIIGWAVKLYLWIKIIDPAFDWLLQAATAIVPVAYAFIRLWGYALEKKHKADMNKIELEKKKEELEKLKD